MHGVETAVNCPLEQLKRHYRETPPPPPPPPKKAQVIFDCLRQRFRHQLSSPRKMLSHRDATTTTTAVAATAPLPYTTTVCCFSSGAAAPGSRPVVGMGHNEEQQQQQQQLTPRASSDAGTAGSDEERTSFSDEAQACFNLLLILRNDTQHLISLRNDNLPFLEDSGSPAPSPPGEGESADDVAVAAAQRPALLACVNESIVAATRSIADMGPFLEKYRWPVCSAPRGPEQQQRRSFIKLKPSKKLLRKRSKSFSGLATAGGPPPVADCNGSGLSPQQLFSWTLALTAQHTAVLVATSRLEQFLEYGVSVVSVEEVKRREGRASWWQQGRGEFENIDLIQSLLAPRPRRKLGIKAPGADAAAGPGSHTTCEYQRVEGEVNGMPVISEHDDGRSETVISEPFSESTTTSSPWGLTAPKHQRQGSLRRDEQFFVRRVVTEPLSYSPSRTTAQDQARLSRTETFGQVKPNFPFSRNNSSAQPPMVTTQLLPPLLRLQDLLPETICRAGTTHDQPTTEDGAQLVPTTGGSPSPLAITDTPTPLLSSLLTHGGISTQPQSQPRDSTPPSSTQPSRPVSIAESSYIPFDPHTSMDQRMVALFAQRALPSKTIQPVIKELDNMLVSPVESQEPHVASLPAGVSPIESPQSRVSLQIPTPTGGETNETHWPYLAYMARKQAVAASRWSLRRSTTSEV